MNKKQKETIQNTINQLEEVIKPKRVRLNGLALQKRDERVIRDYKRGLKWKEIIKIHDLGSTNQIQVIFKRQGFKVYRNDIG